MEVQDGSYLFKLKLQEKHYWSWNLRAKKVAILSMIAMAVTIGQLYYHMKYPNSEAPELY